MLNFMLPPVGWHWCNIWIISYTTLLNNCKSIFKLQLSSEGCTTCMMSLLLSWEVNANQNKKAAPPNIILRNCHECAFRLKFYAALTSDDWLTLTIWWVNLNLYLFVHTPPPSPSTILFVIVCDPSVSLTFVTSILVPEAGLVDSAFRGQAATHKGKCQQFQT